MTLIAGMQLCKTLRCWLNFSILLTMEYITRITIDPNVMGGKPCIRGMRVTVSTVVRLLASGYSNQEILDAYPYLEANDIPEALAYAAWRTQEVEILRGHSKLNERNEYPIDD